MDDCVINIRVFSWHFQLKADPWWRVEIGRNDWHKDNGWPDGYFSVYKFTRLLP